LWRCDYLDQFAGESRSPPGFSDIIFVPIGERIVPKQLWFLKIVSMSSTQTPSPLVVGVVVAVVVAVITVLVVQFFGKKNKADDSTHDAKKRRHEIEVEKVREIVKEHMERKEADAKNAPVQPAVGTASDAIAAVEDSGVTAEAKAAKKRRNKKSKNDPDTEIIALFEKGGKKANKNKPEKNKQRKKHPKLVAAVGGYNSESEEEEIVEQVIGFGKQNTGSSAASAGAGAGATGPEVTASMLAAAAENQFFVSSEDRAASQAAPNTALEIANLKQLELSAELEASLIAGLANNDATDNFFVSSTTSDGWAVVEDKRKVRTVKREVAAVQAAAAAAADAEHQPVTESEPAVAIATPPPAPLVIDITKAQIQVEATKVGLIVGPKGATLKALQEATGAEVIAPRYRDVSSDNKDTVTIHLVGPAEGVATATKAIEDLCAKGYSAVLEGPDFGETTVAVHQSSVADIIGKGGSTRRVLQEQLGVRVIVPGPNSAAGAPVNSENVKITVAGPRMKVSETKKLIKELVKYHHTAVTHPGIAHVEYDPTHMYFNFLNTCRGSEIRNIQTNYKVTVFIPTENSVCKNILVVGEVDNIASAQLYIQKQVEQASMDKNTAIMLSDAWSAANADSKPEDVSSIVANELGSSIANPWMGGLVSSPPVPPIGTVTSPGSSSIARSSNSGSASAAASAAGWDPASAEGW
jgi:rRNA processing protein Krr1/Pno1/Tfp pilus assembly major pilin PilA